MTGNVLIRCVRVSDRGRDTLITKHKELEGQRN